MSDRCSSGVLTEGSLIGELCPSELPKDVYDRGESNCGLPCWAVGVVILIARDFVVVAANPGREVNPGKGASLPFQKSWMLVGLRLAGSDDSAVTASGEEFDWWKRPGGCEKYLG